MLKSNFAVLALFSLCLGFTPKVDATEPDAAASFITTLKNEAMTLYAAGITNEARQIGLCSLVQKHVNIQYLGNFAAGRLPKQMSNEVRTSYYMAVKTKLAAFFDLAFLRLKDGTLTVNPVSKPAGPARIVSVEVVKANRSSTTVQFYVAPDASSGLRLQDAQMSGFTLSQMLKEEFTNILAEVKSDNPDVKGKALIDNITGSNSACP